MNTECHVFVNPLNMYLYRLPVVLFLYETNNFIIFVVINLKSHCGNVLPDTSALKIAIENHEEGGR